MLKFLRQILPFCFGLNETVVEGDQTQKSTQTVEGDKGDKGTPKLDKPVLHEEPGQAIDPIDMIKGENLKRFSNDPVDKDGKAVEVKPKETTETDDEDTTALKSSPFNSREKLEGGFINSFMQLNPDGELPDISSKSVKELVSDYKDLQRQFTSKPPTPTPEDIAVKKESERVTKQQKKIDNPLSNPKVRKSYNALIQEKVRNNIPLTEATAAADKIISKHQREQRLEQDIKVIKAQGVVDDLDKQKISATYRINTIKEEERFKGVDSAEVLKELDGRMKDQGLSENEVVAVVNTVDKQGKAYMLDRVYTDAFNTVLLRKNPDTIAAAKQEGALEADAKIQGGSVVTTGAPSVGKQTAEQKEAAENFKLQESLRFG